MLVLVVTRCTRRYQCKSRFRDDLNLIIASCSSSQGINVSERRSVSQNGCEYCLGTLCVSFSFRRSCHRLQS
jgi:hypothetical protein